MLKGDIDNRVSPRLVVVFEGLLGLLPTPRARGAESLARKAHQWTRAVRQYEINELAAKKIWDVTWRKGHTIDVITWLGDDFAEALQSRLDDENLPVSRVYSTEPHHLARSITYQLDIAAIYDPDPSHAFTFGGKGRHLSPDQAHLLGEF